MPARLRYPEIAPEGYAALSGFGHYVNTSTSLSPVLLGLIYLRASILNGCEFCIEMHSHELRKLHEPETRIAPVESWQASDSFTPRERAALAWTDTLTQLQTGSHASDADYASVGEFFRDKDLVDLTFAIASINAWNRLGVAFKPHWNLKKAQQAASTETSTDGVQSAVDDDDGKVSED